MINKLKKNQLEMFNLLDVDNKKKILSDIKEYISKQSLDGNVILDLEKTAWEITIQTIINAPSLSHDILKIGLNLLKENNNNYVDDIIEQNKKQFISSALKLNHFIALECLFSVGFKPEQMVSYEDLDIPVVNQSKSCLEYALEKSSLSKDSDEIKKLEAVTLTILRYSFKNNYRLSSDRLESENFWLDRSILRDDVLRYIEKNNVPRGNDIDTLLLIQKAKDFVVDKNRSNAQPFLNSLFNSI